MNVTFSRPRDPRHVPEHVLWTLRRGGRIAEALTRMVPFGPQLSIYVTRRETGQLALLWSQVFRVEDGGGVALGKLAEETRRDYEARGWTPSS